MQGNEASEYIVSQSAPGHRGDVYGSSDDDQAARARHHDNERVWTVESYDAKLTRRMLELGAQRLPSRIDGALFCVDAQQLILFIAASSGLVLEFRSRKRQQLSPEKQEARRQRMAAMNAKQRVQT